MAKSQHSAKFSIVKKYYSMGMWDNDKVRNAVVKGWITEAEYKEITGEDY